MQSDDGWSVFGEDDSLPPVAVAVPQPVVGAGMKRRSDALTPFADASGQEVAVPPPPPPPVRVHSASDAAAALCVWPDSLPRAVGPIAVRTSPVSGRGFVATRDIRPGEILMVEEPRVPWPSTSRETGGGKREPLALLRALLRRRDRVELLAALARLHPLSLDNLPASDLEDLAEEYRATIDSLLLEPGACMPTYAHMRAYTHTHIQQPLTLCCLSQGRVTCQARRRWARRVVRAWASAEHCCASASRHTVFKGASALKDLFEHIGGNTWD